MDNDKMIYKTYDETYKKIDKSIVKVETVERKQSSENIALNFVEVPSIETNVSIATSPKKRCYTIQPKPKHHYPFESSSIRKIRFRPIQPKPSESNKILKNKLEMPVMNMATLSPDRVFVARTVPNEKNIQYITSSDVSDEIHCRKNSNNSDNGNIVTFEITEKNKIDKTVNTKNSNIRVNSSIISNINNNSNSKIINNNSSSNCKNLRYIKKPTTKLHKNSIQLFFESMAQTVLNLPNEIQAEIKMEICKIVTMAEIKCSQSQFKTN